MKSKLWSTGLCFCLLCVVPSPGEAQVTAPQQPTPAQPATPAQAAPAQPPPAAPIPPKKEDRDTGGDNFSIEPFYWDVKKAPVLRLGYAGEFTTNAYGMTIYNQTTPGNLNFPGSSKYGDGIVVTVPTPKENSVQFTFWHVEGGGNTTAATDLILFSNTFPMGDALVTSYAFQDYKLSWNYLTYPYPSNGSKFRFLTLWEFQFLNVTSLTACAARRQRGEFHRQQTHLPPDSGRRNRISSHEGSAIRGQGFGIRNYPSHGHLGHRSFLSLADWTFGTVLGREGVSLQDHSQG